MRERERESDDEYALPMDEREEGRKRRRRMVR